MDAQAAAAALGDVGQRKLSITADTYTLVLSDGAEPDYSRVLVATA